jgi:hypothetical protein
LINEFLELPSLFSCYFSLKHPVYASRDLLAICHAENVLSEDLETLLKDSHG